MKCSGVTGPRPGGVIASETVCVGSDGSVGVASPYGNSLIETLVVVGVAKVLTSASNGVVDLSAFVV